MIAFKYNDMQLPCKAWVNDIADIEPGAVQQIKNVSNLPFLFHHLAIMPDVHQGYGTTIGSVGATVNCIVPNFVGVDIGCGMCAVKTPIMELDTEKLKKIMTEIRKAVPVGFEHHKDSQINELRRIDSTLEDCPTNYTEYMIVNREFKSAMKQIGTLGGGRNDCLQTKSII